MTALQRVETQNALALLTAASERGTDLLSGRVVGSHRYRARARAPQTQIAYAKQWRNFVEWCACRIRDGHSRPVPNPLPADPELVEFYIEHLAELGRAATTIQKAMSAIAAVHALSGHFVPSGDPGLRETMKGVRREVGIAPRFQAAPIGASEITKMIAVMTPGMKATRDIALLTVGMAGGFRRSELGSMLVEDLRFVPDGGVVIRLRRSKKDQEGRGHERKLSPGQYAHTCPVQALRVWLASSQIKSGPLFRGVSRHGKVYSTGKGLNGRSVDKIIRTRTRSAGLTGHFSGHSLRAGCINALARLRTQMQVQKHVDHASAESTARYFRTIEIEMSNITKDIGL